MHDIEDPLTIKSESNNDWNCKYCDFKATSKNSLTGHISWFHLKEISGEGKYELRGDNWHCLLCDYSCRVSFINNTRKRNNIRRHMKTHEKKAYSCHICDSSFDKEGRLETHLFSKHGTRFECPHCEKTFRRKDHRAQHIKTHFNSTEQEVEIHNDRQRVDIDQFTKVRKCLICEFSGKGLLSIRQHFFEQHIDERMSFKSLSQIFYQCNECGYQSKLIASLKLHYDNQHSTEDHSCHVCGYIARSRRQLQRHIHDHHVKPESHDKCEKCKKFIPKNQFNEHNCEAPTYVCNVCGKVYATPSGLHFHMNSKHTKMPRNHICSVCGKDFRSRNDLKNYITIALGIIKITRVSFFSNNRSVLYLTQSIFICKIK